MTLMSYVITLIKNIRVWMEKEYIPWEIHFQKIFILIPLYVKSIAMCVHCSTSLLFSKYYYNDESDVLYEK